MEYQETRRGNIKKGSKNDKYFGQANAKNKWS